MGIYFIAAGDATDNRYKSLDESFNLSDLEPYLPKRQFDKLEVHFLEKDPIYVWGATKNRFKQLKLVNSGEYVVDVKNREVMNVFEFCFQYQTPDNKLQDFIGWDKQRSYKYVYFLKNPRKPAYTSKSYFGRSFGYDNPHWLSGQKYFNDQKVNEALNRTNSKSQEEFLGIKADEKAKENKSSEISEEKNEYRAHESPKKTEPDKQPLWKQILEWLKAFPGLR